MKKRIIILSPRFPFPAHKGDQLVVFNCIKYLSQRYEIDLLSFHNEEVEGYYYNSIKRYCTEIVLVRQNRINIFYQMFKSLFSDKPLQAAYFYSNSFQSELSQLLKKNKYDLVFPFTLRMSEYAQNIKINKYIHLIDSMYLNMKRRANNEVGIKKLIFNYESKKVRLYERKLIHKYDKSFLVSQIDKEVIDKQDSSIIVFPNGTEVHDCKKDLSGERLNIVFTGNMGYFPNQDAVVWFVKNCWNSILCNFSNANFKIIGKSPSKKIKDFQCSYKNIEVLGFVDSISSELCKADIAISPMQSGSGMQNKILEAFAVKTPVVTTTLGLGDIKAKKEKDILVADTAADFIKKINYLADKEERNTIGENGFNYALKNHSWEKIIYSRINI
jgi:polysaccharide biosynthesis protein PslH